VPIGTAASEGAARGDEAPPEHDRTCGGGHSGTLPPYLASMADDRHDGDPHEAEDGPPQYTVYKSRPRLLRRGDDTLDDLRTEIPRPDGEPPRRRRWLPWRRRPGRRRLSFGRFVAYLLLALTLWVGVSLILFLVSAQVHSESSADSQLKGAGFTLTSPNTILVLGSDARVKGKAEPGAQIGGPSRSDSIMLMRLGGGRNATLSIPRDTVVDIPGHGRNKINAAYAFGGAPLAVKTVEQYLGIDVNHVIEVNFANFPELIDALGGVTYKGGCVVSRINGGAKNGGTTLRLRAGSHELNGDQALALARTRHNECNPRESDLTRARRQQKILSAIKDKVISLETFVRLPWVSWAAPKAVHSDMVGPSLLGLVGADLIGGGAKRRVLKPSGAIQLPDGGAGLAVSEAEKRDEVGRFLAG
jgi:LCP family protein required for cell wall assembly